MGEASSSDGESMSDDLDLIRRGMQMLGEDVTPEDSGAGAKVLPLRRRRWVAYATLGSAAAITAGIFAVSTLDGDLKSTESNASSADPTAMLTWAGFASCQDSVVEGKIIKIDDSLSNDTYILTVDVSHWLKPTTGPRTTELTVKGRPGGHSFQLRKRVLIAAAKANDDGGRPTSEYWYDSEEIAKFGGKIEENLPESESISCPNNWKTVS